MIRHKLFWFSCAFLAAISVAAQSRIERVEPPFWWAGMHNPDLQLLVYGKDLKGYQARLDYPGASIVGQHQAESPNYLFIDLHFAWNVLPGQFAIVLKQEGRPDLQVDYRLEGRTSGSAYREAFSPADAIYLITPDRFANGDPSNDQVDGMPDPYNRSDPFGRHGGDLQGIRDHLDYIRELGFTAIWLNPVLENNQPAQSYHGYATTDFYRVDPRFGTNSEYRKLCEESADKGVKVIMDMIANHCGHHHWWMQDLPFSDWINYQEHPEITNHRRTVNQDPHAAPGDRERFASGWFVTQMPDLNQRNPFMANYIIQNSIWWVEYAHLSGIRQDTYSYPDKNFMADWTCRILNEYPNFNIVGEEWIGNPSIVSYWQRGKINMDGYTSCLPSLMDFPVTMALHQALNEKEGFSTGWVRLYDVLANDFVYPDPGNLTIFPDNHDMSRILTQVGEDVAKDKLALAFILTTRGIPQIYYGTEVLMSNPGTDSHGVIRSDFPGGWSGDRINAFTGKGLSEAQRDMLHFLKTILQWRQHSNAVQRGQLMHFAPEQGIYVYFRYQENDQVMVILNKNEKPVQLDMDRFEERLQGRRSGWNVLQNVEISWSGQLELQPMQPLIIEMK
ncbi:MAG: glycoside hydrolase family 13 protein [Saprospiraceae bacterium]|nr:glycoside hydrolase family 13 protein [Saprospiraceae bacterium]